MIKYLIKKYLFNFSLSRYETTMFFSQARKYLLHLKYCQKLSKINIKNNLSSGKFIRDGYCTFKSQKSEKIAINILKKIKNEEKQYKKVWDESTGKYLRGDIFKKFPEILELFNKEIKEVINQIYKSNFCIYFGILYKSSYTDKEREGSQLWHVDGGPGTCINLMYCISEINENNGSMKCLTWQQSKLILKLLFKKYEVLNKAAKLSKLDKISVRRKKSELLNLAINKNFSSRVFQPKSGPGLFYAFKNNCIHSGGYPTKGKERYVCVFHIYPNEKELNTISYLKNGIKKTSPYPIDPFKLS